MPLGGFKKFAEKVAADYRAKGYSPEKAKEIGVKVAGKVTAATNKAGNSVNKDYNAKMKMAHRGFKWLK